MSVTRARIVAALKMGARSVADLEILAFTGQRNVMHILKQLREEGAIHVCRWQRGPSGPFRPIYRWGAGADAVRPSARSTAEVCKAYRQRMREKHGENYGLVHEAWKHRVPGRQIVVEGKVVYQQ